MRYRDLDVVALLSDIPEKQLRAGVRGTIHQAFAGNTPIYYIEFEVQDDDGDPIMASVPEDCLKLVWSYDSHSYVD